MHRVTVFICVSPCPIQKTQTPVGIPALSFLWFGGHDILFVGLFPKGAWSQPTYISPFTPCVLTRMWRPESKVYPPLSKFVWIWNILGLSKATTVPSPSPAMPSPHCQQKHGTSSYGPWSPGVGTSQVLSAEWSISCHFNKQVCHSHPRHLPSKCKFLSPGRTMLGYLPAVNHSVRLVSCEQGTKDVSVKRPDADPASLRCVWEEWLQWAETLASSLT